MKFLPGLYIQQAHVSDMQKKIHHIQGKNLEKKIVKADKFGLFI